MGLTSDLQYISPFMATPDDYDNRARIPSHVCAGLCVVRAFEPFVSLGTYDEFMRVATRYIDDPLVWNAYTWLRDNRSQYELGGIYGFIVYDVN